MPSTYSIWTDASDVRGVYKTGQVDGVRLLNGDVLLLNLVSSGTAYDNANPATLRSRIIAADGSSITTPINVVNTPINMYPESNYWQTYRLSDGRVVAVMGIGSTERIFIVLMDAAGAYLDSDGSVLGRLYGAAVSDDDVLFFTYRVAGSDVRMYPVTFTGNNVTLGAEAVLPPQNTAPVSETTGWSVVSDDYVFAIAGGTSLNGGYYSAVPRTGSTLGTPAAWTSLGEPPGYTGKKYGPQYSSSRRSVRRPGTDDWYIIGYVVDEGPSGAEWPSIARLTPTGGALAVTAVSKWPSPGGTEPYIRFFNPGGAYHMYTFQYFGEPRPFKVYLLDSGPAVWFYRKNPTATYVDFAVIRFTYDLVPISNIEAISLETDSPDAVTGLTTSYSFLGGFPVGDAATTAHFPVGQQPAVGSDRNFAFAVQYTPPPMLGLSSPPGTTLDDEPDVIVPTAARVGQIWP